MNIKSLLNENYFPEDDKLNTQQKSNTRRPRLTLRHLNKLRKIRELKRLEMSANKEFVAAMYGQQSQGEDEGLGF